MPAELKINDSGTWRTITELKVNDAGTWRTIQEVYVNDSGTWRTVFVGDVLSLADQSINDFNTGSAGGSIQIKSTGTYESSTVISGLTDYGNWITPTASAGGYEVFVTPTGDALDGGSAATGSWLALTSSRTWTLTATSGLKSVSLAFQIRRASDGTVVDTATITIDVDAT